MAPAIFIALFALLLASFPARNPDIWGQLAAGRDLVQWRPFAAVQTWAPDAINGQSWLFKLGCFTIFSVAGGIGLVGMKAVAIAGLALVVLRLSRVGPGWMIPTFCTGLALLAMSPRLLLQPASMSFIFLGLMFWLVHARPAEADRATRPAIWPLAVLFLLWVNTDRWFVLGLVVVALLWIGRVLDRTATMRRGVLALLVLAAVCIANPAHIAAFVPPLDLNSPLGDAAGTRDVWTPFQPIYLESVRVSPAGLAYYPLLGLGLVSFFMTRFRWDRFLPWFALAVLSGLQVRTIPFFAVVAGPILAWNLQDFFARRNAMTKPNERQTSRFIAAVLWGTAGLLGLAFLACSWTGWLQASPFEPRRWGIDTPPALTSSAAALRALQSEGKLGQSVRVLHMSPATAAAFAWFCPDIPGVRDSGLIASLLGERGAASDWPQRMRSAGITHLVVYDTNRARLFAILDRLLAEPRQWPLVLLDGRVSVFGWRDPQKAERPATIEELPVDLDRLALQPTPDAQAPTTVAATTRKWWEAFWKSAPQSSGDRDEAALRLLQAGALRRSAPRRHFAAWEGTQLAGLVGSANGWGSPFGALGDANTRLVFFRPPLLSMAGPAKPAHLLGELALAYQPVFVSARDDSPIAALYLAIRAARRAIAQNPDDAQAHATLGEAYLHLLHNTREREWGRRMSELAQLRRAQAAAALNRALELDPNLPLVHFNLGALYEEMAFLDLSLQHRQAYVAGVRKSGVTARLEMAHEATVEAERNLDQLAEAVAVRQREFDSESTGLRVLDRAILARDKGLAGQARDILLASHISAFGATGMAMELELLVRTGRAKEVLAWTDPEQQAALGPMYHWLRLQALAATGNYGLAKAECTWLALESADTAPGPRVVIAGLAGRAVLDGQRGLGDRAGPHWQAFRQADLRSRLPQLVAAIRREADALTLRGLLALEEGATEAAADDFRKALVWWGSDEAVADRRGLEFNGRVVAQGALAWIESVTASGNR